MFSPFYMFFSVFLILYLFHLFFPEPKFKIVIRNSSYLYSIKHLIIALFIVFTIYFSSISITGFIGYRAFEKNCVEFLSRGVIYHDQPYCFQGIIGYLYGLIFSRLFGWDTFIHHISGALLLLLSFHMLFILHSIIKREYGKCNLPILIVLVFSLIVNSVFRGGYGIPTFSFLATYFSFLGILFLRKNYSTTNMFMGGLFLTLGLHTSLITAPLTGLVLLDYFFTSLHVRAKLSDSSLHLTFSPLSGNVFKKFFILILPFFILSLTFGILFPNYYDYIFSQTETIHSKPLIQGLSEVLTAWLRFRSISLTLLMSFFVVSLYGVLKFNLRYSWFSFFTFLTYMITYPPIHTLGIFWDWRFFYPLLPLTIIQVLFFYERCQNFKQKLLLLSYVVFLAFYQGSIPAYIFNDLNHLFWDSRIVEIEYGLHFIPPQQGKVLMEGEEPLYPRGFIEKYNLSLSPEQIVQIRNMLTHAWAGGPKFDDTTLKPLLRKGIVNISNKSYYHQFTEAVKSPSYDPELFNQLLNELDSGKFSLVIESPPSWATITTLLKNTRTEFCRVYVPNFAYLSTGGRRHTTLHFLNLRDCEEMKRRLLNYYSSKFDEICSHSKLAARIVNLIMYYNALPFSRFCNSTSEFIPELEKIRVPGYRFTKDDIFYLLIITFSVYLFLRWDEKKK